MDALLVVLFILLFWFAMKKHSKVLYKYMPRVGTVPEIKHSSYPRKYRRRGHRADYHDTTQVLFGSDRDHHGCIRSAGYSWNEDQGKCTQPWQNHRVD
jgi:hypothetical protein